MEREGKKTKKIRPGLGRGAPPIFMFQLVDHNDDVCDVAFGQGGDMLISGSSDYTALIWRMGLNQSPVPIAELTHPDAVSGVDFHPEGREVVTACADGGVRVWASAPLAHTVKPIELREYTCAVPLWSACFSPDGTHIASGASDGTIPVWCLQAAISMRKYAGF